MTGNRLLDYLLLLDDNTFIYQLLEFINRDKVMVIDLCNESIPNII